MSSIYSIQVFLKGVIQHYSASQDVLNFVSNMKDLNPHFTFREGYRNSNRNRRQIKAEYRVKRSGH